MALLYEVFYEARSPSAYGAAKAQAASDEASSLIEEVTRLDLTGLDETATRKLCTAKERFKDARKEATKAFNNEGLITSDRILAMKYRVMATILETVDNPADAVTPCGVCVKELNSLPAVQNSFKTGIDQKMRGLVGKEVRGELISTVCLVNPVIVEVTLSLGRVGFWSCPSVDIGENRVISLCDSRVTDLLPVHDKEFCCVPPWSFDLQGEEEHELKYPRGIATNSSGEFLVAGCAGIKVFDSNGKFVKHFSLPTNEGKTEVAIYDVVIDIKDNIFVLTKMENPEFWWVYKLTKTADLYHKFCLRDIDREPRQRITIRFGRSVGEIWGKYSGLSVRDTGEVITFWNRGLVEEYDTDGKFIRNFGEGILDYVQVRDCNVASDGCVMVLVRATFHSCHYVYIFSKCGEYLNRFQMQRYSTPYARITFNRVGEHVVVAGAESEEAKLLLEIYTKDVKFVCSSQIQSDGIHVDFRVGGITMTPEGWIAVVVGGSRGWKVFLFQNTGLMLSC